MSGYKTPERNKRGERLTVVSRWVSRDSLPTDLREHSALFTNNFRSNDWSSWINEFNLTLTWYGYRIAITVASLTAFITGIGQLLYRLIGY